MPGPDWVDIATGYIPGVPASRRLIRGGDLVDGNRAIDGHLATGLAAAAYWLKNGQSVVLSLPPVGPSLIFQVADYLHSCRTDAMAGFMRASWFQPCKMGEASDLLVWTRSQKQKLRLQAAGLINPVFIGTLRDHDRIAGAMDREERLYRTLVCQQDHSTLKLCDSLDRLARPFAVVIDATPWGVRDFVLDLAEQMAVYFPDSPRLFITTAGDRDIAGKLEKYLPDVPAWSTGRLDKVLFGQRRNARWEGRIAVIPDKKINDRLSSIYRYLKTLESEVKAPAHKEIYALLLRVWRVILNMVVPIEFHELSASSQRKGGLYPIRPIADDLRLARKTKMPSGTSQRTLDEACTEIQALMEFMASGISGKTQAVHRWVQETLRADQKGLIATGSARDADVIRRFLLEKYHQAVVDRKIQVVSARGVNQLYLMNREVDRVFVASGVWKSDYWIAGLGKDFTWACYPIQQDCMEKWSHEIQYVKHASSDKAKADWWIYGSGEQLETPKALACEHWGDCAGQYTSKEVFSFEFESNAQWLLDLLKDLEWHEKPELQTAERIPSDPVTVFTREGAGAYYFEMGQRVETLREDSGTEKVPANELASGDTIIIQTHGSEDSHLLDTIMEAVNGETGNLQFLRDFASKWRPMVHAALNNCGGDLARLEKRLSTAGATVTRQTLSNWLEGRNLIGKNKDKIMPAIAKIAGDEYSDELAKSIRRAIGDLQGKRTAAGRILHKARLAALQDKDVITVNGEDLPTAILLEQVRCEEVLSVVLPETEESGEDESLDWVSKVAELADNSDGKLIITPAAKKSLENSQYKDRGRAVESIALFLTEFYPVFFGDRSIEDAKAVLNDRGIKYRGGMADVTQGALKDVYKAKVYKGRKADLGRHFRIGNSWNKERCFSVHFEVDKEDAALVIHHAGEHLRTSRG